jgi:hypothetical protein
MRGLGSVLLGAIVGGFIAGVAQLQMAIAFQSGEEFIGPMFLLMLIVIFAAFVFAVALIAGGNARSLTRAALGIFAGIVLLLAFITVAGQPFPPAITQADAIVIAQILIPALLAIAIQWRFAQRYLRKTAAVAATGTMIGTRNG